MVTKVMVIEIMSHISSRGWDPRQQTQFLMKFKTKNQFTEEAVAAVNARLNDLYSIILGP